MSDDTTERFPAGYNWRSRFADAQQILRLEGGSVWSAEAGGAWWVITDEGTLADLLPESDWSGLVVIRRFDDVDAWKQVVAEVRGTPLRVRAETLLRTALPLIAAHAEAQAAAKRLQRINERDHLQPWTMKILGESADARRGPDVGSAFAVEFPQHWPRLGNVDVSLSAPEGPHAFVELKCGESPDALGPCVWDLAKLAMAIRRGATCAGFLLAAATAANWDRPIRGAEFFNPAQWGTEALRTTYEDWWRSWEKRGDPPPVSLPKSGAVVPLGSADFQIEGAAWRLQCSRVTVEPTDWFRWEPLLAQGG